MTKFISQLARITGGLLFAVALISGSTASAEDSYYKEGYSPMFNPAPRDSGKRSWKIRYFGPVGIGIDLKRPGMTMEINNVEEGSPADKTGKLKKGQIIESINGVVLKDYDPRIILGELITRAEATDGIIDLKIKGEGNVRVQIPVMGNYSETWPVNCPKSDKIVRNLADLIAQQEKPSNGSVLFLLSTGEEKDLAVVRRWMRDIDQVGGITWDIGYKGIGVCEYYLRTGDKSVLPAIRQSLQDLKDRMYQGGWSGRGMPASFTYSTGTGQVHASGMYAMNFVLMARLCGVEVEERMLQETLKQFYRFAGHGNVPYGNGPPEGGFRDNGKQSGLAISMATAAQLTPEGESSVYANARDLAAMKAFYATNWFHAAHTGGGMGEIWHHGAMALMREKRPVQYRSYMDTRRWVMDLSRRHDGSIAIEGMDDRYNRSLTDAKSGRDWGTFFALTYTYPRKQLQLWGAPRSPHAKHHPLPARPWGNAMDDVFQSTKPIYIGENVKLTMEELRQENIREDASLPVLRKLDEDTTEEELFKYLLHPEYGFRVIAMRRVVTWDWDHLVLPLLKSGDPRLRQAGLLAITGMFKGPSLSEEQLTPEMFDAVGKMIDDPNEAWWTALYAIKALERAEPDRIGEHRDRLLQFLEYDSVFIQESAVATLTKIATEREHYEIVLPAVINTFASFMIDSSYWQAQTAIEKAIAGANSEVKAFAKPLLQKAYASVPPELKDPYTGASPRGGAEVIRKRIGSIVRELPGGESFIRSRPLMTRAAALSGRKDDQYQYSGRHTPNAKAPGTWSTLWPRPKSPDEFEKRMKGYVKKYDKPPQKPKDTMTLVEGGDVKGGRFRDAIWSGNWLLNFRSRTAHRVVFRTYEGVDFMFVESGNFEKARQSEDWHGFYAYVRNSDLAAP